MRKIVYFSMLACLSVFSAAAQTPLTISEQNVERKGQNVTVTFRIDAAQDAVRHGEKIIVTHMLKPAGSRSDADLSTGSLYVASARQQKILRQKERLSDVGEPAVCIGNGETFTYVATLPYDTSLNPRSYSLSVSAVKMGCCSLQNCMSEDYDFEVGPAITPVVQNVAPSIASVREHTHAYPFLRMVGTDVDDSRGISIRFPFAKTVLDPDFLSNEKALKDIVDAITMVLEDDWAELHNIDIAGYASPEGNTKQNQQLSIGRAEALKEYIMKEFGFTADRFNITAGGEDWIRLRALVADSDMPYRDEIIDIIDNVPQEKRQARLKALAGGRPYKSMSDVLYPKLRDACYINVWFSEKKDAVVDEINTAVQEIGEGKYSEALERLMAHEEDERTWNAIGSIMVLTEDLKEAKKWFEKAAKAGDADAAKNLAQLEEIIK